MAKINPLVKRMYVKYLKMLPLDLTKEKNNSLDAEGWKNNVQLSIFDFCRVLGILVDNNNLKDLTHSGMDLDFDNIAPIIFLLAKEEIMKFNKPNHYNIKNLRKNKIEKKPSKISIIKKPNGEFNQFPCSKNSVLKRVETLVEDFPFANSLNVGLFGDDDLVSIEIARKTNFTPIVFEIDQKIINRIKFISKKEKLNIKLIKKDFRKVNLKDYKLDTFITDPPYTVGGVLTFLYHGINSLKIKDRFYLVANQMFLGYKGFYEIMKILVNSGTYPIKIINAYNEYPLPRNYRESFDIKNNFKGNINPNKINSSSSSLFVFRISDKIKTDKILEFIKKEKDIYDRYRRFSNG